MVYFALLFFVLLLPDAIAYAATPIEGEVVLFNNMPQWVLLMPAARCTHYGSYFQAGMLTASGEPYDPDGDGCAVGPMILKRLRTEYAEASGTFIILPTWEGEPLTWGWTLRLSDGEGRMVTCRVNDSGLDGLDVDLGDGAWERAYVDKGQGVKIVTLEVLR